MANTCTAPSLEDLGRPRCIPNPQAPEMNWRDKSETAPFVNPRNCHYSIVVDKAYVDNNNLGKGITQHESPGGNPNTRLRTYFAYGVDRLIEFYRKDLSAGGVTRRQLIDAVISQGKRWNVSERPGSKMKVLVALPYDIFHDLPERIYTPSYNLNQKFTISYDVRTLKAKVDFVIARIKDYKSPSGFSFGVGSYGNPSEDLRNLNFQTEARNMESFLTYLQTFLNYNEVDIDLGSVDTARQEFIEFVMEPPILDISGAEKNQLYQQKKELQERIKEGYGTDNAFQRASRWVDVTRGNVSDPGSRSITDTRRADEMSAADRRNADRTALADIEGRIADIEEMFASGFKLLDVRYTFRDTGPKYLKIAWPTSTTGNWNRNRTVGLIYWVNELFNLYNNQLTPPMTSFAETYIYPPIDTSAADLEPEWSKDLKEGLETVQQIGDDVMGFVDDLGDLFGGNHSLMPLIDNYIKTQAELLSEDSEILSTAFQASTAASTERLFRLSDKDLLSSAASRSADAIANNLEAVYDMVLNHVDLRYIILKLATCLGLDPLTMDPWLLELIIALLEFLLWLADMDLATFDFDFNWAMIWRDITEALVNYALNFLIDLVNSIITELVMMLLMELDKLCEEEIDYDSVDLSGLISDNFASPREAANFFGSLASNMGDGPAEQSGGLLRQLIKDISAVLSTKEMCSLIQGKASTEVLTIVHNIILLDKYSRFHRKFQTLEDVSNFFHGFSKLIDPSFCELGKLTPDTFSDLCKSQFEASENIRRKLLSNKDGISSQQIEDQIADERQRRENLLNEIMSLISSEGGVGAAINKKFSEGLQNSDILEKIGDHPSTREGISNMKSAVFDNTVSIFAEDGLGPLETPYRTIEYVKKLAAFAIGGPFLVTETFPMNMGIMHNIADSDQHYFYRYGSTTGLTGQELANVKLGDGLVDHLNWINLNEYTIPDITKPYNRPIVRTADSTFSYKTKVYPRIGFWGNHQFGEGERTYNIYETSYDTASREAVATRWDRDLSYVLDNPVIKTFFIRRDPFVGIPVDALSENGVPIGMSRGPQLKAHPAGSRYDKSPDRELIRLKHSEFLRKHNARAIDVFNDLPKVFEDNLVPFHNRFVIFDETIRGGNRSRQEATYVNLVGNVLKGFPVGEPANERLLANATPRKVVDSYKCVFNDVMRILYRFVTDSEFHSGKKTTFSGEEIPQTKHMLNTLGTMFRDPEKMLDLLGLTGDIEGTIKQKISSSLSAKSSSSEATVSVIGEPLVRYLIRIYILEIYLKNLYMLTSSPSSRYPLGKQVYDVGEEQTIIELDVSNPQIYSMLDLNDTLDPIMVSYIAEYIDYSSSRSIGCDSFYDIAHKIMSDRRDATEDEEGQKETLSVPGAGDTLAYYPSKQSKFGSASERRGKKAAFRYLVAEELKAFVPTFQSFIELKNFLPQVRREETFKRTLMESFLDKFEILGYNIPTAPRAPDLDPPFVPLISEFNKWLDHGEGLYMQFYYREAQGSDVMFFDQSGANNAAPDALSNDSRVGLRICLRDSLYHPSAGSDTPSRGDKFSTFADPYYDYAKRLSAGSIGQRALCWSKHMGIPVLQYEATWGDIKEAKGISINGLTGLNDSNNKRKIMEYMKQEIVKTDDFRVMFEYVFPVKKLFNFMFIQMDQNVSAFLVNTKVKGAEFVGDPATVGPTERMQLDDLGIKRKSVLGASSIDPEQFMQAKSLVKSILENVNNSDNYRYINAETEEAGGQGKLALMKQMMKK